jgi:hypothetical protein
MYRFFNSRFTDAFGHIQGLISPLLFLKEMPKKFLSSIFNVLTTSKSSKKVETFEFSIFAMRFSNSSKYSFRPSEKRNPCPSFHFSILCN